MYFKKKVIELLLEVKKKKRENKREKRNCYKFKGVSRLTY